MSGGALVPVVERFVEAVSPMLATLSPKIRPEDVAMEAFNLAASFVDADGRHSDEELSELATAFSPWLAHLAGVDPARMRADGLVDGTRAWKDKPSALLEVLAASDRRGTTRFTRRYYDLAMHLAHTVCSIDEYPAAEELADLDRFRGMLLGVLAAAGIDRTEAPAASAPTPSAAPPVTEPPLPPAEPVDKLLAELDALVGLSGVKTEVRLVADLIQVQNLRRRRGLPVVEGSRHLVFTGNPGTGKTTVARLLARIYRSLDVVEKGHLVEADRSGLVAGYVGQTAILVRGVIERALGGVLLIDEAYALARGGERDFGQEAIDTLVKLMEDHRDDFVVIAAGYPTEMETFIDSNPGLRSRFPKTIQFDDYSDDELLAIVEGQCGVGGYRLTTDSRAKVLAFFAAQPRGRGFGNGRVARNLLEAAIGRQAGRLVKVTDPTDEQLTVLEAVDVPDPEPSS